MLRTLEIRLKSEYFPLIVIFHPSFARLLLRRLEDFRWFSAFFRRRAAFFADGPAGRAGCDDRTPLPSTLVFYFRARFGPGHADSIMSAGWFFTPHWRRLRNAGNFHSTISTITASTTAKIKNKNEKIESGIKTSRIIIKLWYVF